MVSQKRKLKIENSSGHLPNQINKLPSKLPTSRVYSSVTHTHKSASERKKIKNSLTEHKDSDNTIKQCIRCTTKQLLKISSTCRKLMQNDRMNCLSVDAFK